MPADPVFVDPLALPLEVAFTPDPNGLPVLLLVTKALNPVQTGRSAVPVNTIDVWPLDHIDQLPGLADDHLILGFHAGELTWWWARR